MAVKTSGRIIRKERKNAFNCRCQETVRDEIALKDEILDLKRQVMFLKRTNERNLVKFRKYEDEAKRKDREIEQLMDPRKNGEITKMLSTKGAAILMNLKDQNDSLIQMIITKDNQIRRLVAEIKTAKLYGAPRKPEANGSELIRLRNLLVKSHEIFKENLDRQQNRHRGSNGNSVSEKSTVSDGISPREINELKFTIQSLETHVKYSNELLAQKNREIVNLTEELNDLRNSVSSAEKTAEVNSGNGNGFSGQEKSPLSGRSGQSSSMGQCQTARDDISVLFEKTLRVCDRNETEESTTADSSMSLPAGNSKFSPNHDSRFRISDDETGSEELLPVSGEISNGNEIDSSQKVNVVIWTGRKNGTKRARRMCSLMKRDRFEKQISNGEAETEGKNGKKRKKNWIETAKSNFNVRKPIGEDESEKIPAGSNFHKVKRDAGMEEAKSEEEAGKKNEILIRLQENFGNIIEIHDSSSINIECEKKDSNGEAQKSTSFSEFDGNGPNITDLTSEESAKCREHAERNSETVKQKNDGYSSRIPEKIMPDSANEERHDYEKVIKSFREIAETSQIKKDICNMASRFSPEVQRELRNLYDNLSTYEEVEMSKVNSPIDTDSSFDTENFHPTAKRFVRVEVEINSVEKITGENSDDCPSEKLEINCENNMAKIDIDDDDDDNNNDDEDDDDDDVIVPRGII